MPWSKLDIVNLAMNILAKKSVNAISDSGEFSDAADRAIELLRDSELSKSSWRFATKIQDLSVLVAAPPLDRWSYQLQIPSDYLAVVTLHPRGDYQIYGDKMYANNNDIKLEYRYRVDYEDMPGAFVNFFAHKLAHWFAGGVANNEGAASRIKSDMMQAMFEAQFADSQSTPSVRIASSPIVAVRGGGYYNEPDNPPTTV